jgi:3-oxoacyl-[acyl-carrier protein] reductase
MNRDSTPGILHHPDPRDWRNHRFGLPPDRWDRLRGRSFWVTGAGTGYGRCIAIALAAAESRVFLTGRRREKLEETRADAAALGMNPAACIAIPADITDADEVGRAADAIARHTGGLFGLINNAALPEPRPGPWPLSDLDVGQWNALLATNVTGQWLVSKAALPLLAQGPGFRMVFMTSEAGWAFTPGFGPYNASKAAVNSLGASFAAECAARYPDKDVQINVLVPGEARTEMNQGSAESPYSVVTMMLALLSHPAPGPNGFFFHRDGRHLAFAYAPPYRGTLFEPAVRGSAQKLGRMLKRLWPRN